MPLEPGERIERYIIDSPLGSGGMGEVYRARDGRLQRSVALKILHPPPPERAGASPSAGAGRMLREARAAAALEHPNVVAIYDVGEIETPEKLRGTAYLAMELVKGETLRTHVGDPRVPMSERIRWLADIARALAAAHAAGLVHRDIKPENVMIREDGVVKVLDFGVAKRAVSAPIDPTSSTEGYTLPTMTGQGLVVGTPLYMAPEQLRGEAVDYRADQFAWGVVAYELITGKLPWDADGGGIALVAQILSATPKVPAESGVLPHVADVISRAMAKDPAARFASMNELLAALDALGQTVPRMPVASVPPESRVPLPLLVPPAVEHGAPAPQVKTVRSRPPPSPFRARTVLALTSGAAVVLAIAAGAFALRARTKPPAVASEAAPATVTRCGSNTECSLRLGQAAVCHRDDGRCAALASPDCEVLAQEGDLKSDATVWIGSMFPLTGDAERAYGRSNANASELARRDFAQAMRSIITQGGAPPIALVSCDDSRESSRAARHLVDDVRVPAVVGFASSAEAIDLAESVFLPRGVMTVAALNTSPLLTTLPHPKGGPRLVWRTTYSTLGVVPAIVALVNRKLEPEARAKDHLSPGSPVRIALLREGGAGLLAFSDALFRALRFNGKSALDNGGDFHEFVCDEGCLADPEGASAAMARSLNDFAPHVIVFGGGGGLVKRVVVPLERDWRAHDHRPVYVDDTVPPPDFLRWIGTDAGRRRRFFAVTSVSNTLPNARFVMHYNATFAEPVTRTIAPNTSYDAFYALAFAAYAAKGPPLDGSALANAMGRLVGSGHPVEVGPSGIYEAFDALRSGGSIDLTGATGLLDFDLKTGEAPVDMSILCVDLDSKGFAFDTRESGLVFRARQQTLDGVAQCP